MNGDGAVVRHIRANGHSLGEQIPGKEAWLSKIPAFHELRVVFESQPGLLWCFMEPIERPSVTNGLVREGRELQNIVRQLHAQPGWRDGGPIRYMVWGATSPGIFNLGGDLKFFGQAIRNQDREALVAYATACIDVVHANIVNLELPLVTMSLVEGDALGGGFEKALSTNIVIAERNARFGLPEVMFNLFPGMGAYSLIARRLGAAQAKRMVLSGRLYTAEDLYDMGLVDQLAEPGQGREAVYHYVDRHKDRYAAQRALFEVDQRVNPVSYEELIDIAMLWVGNAMALSETDLRRMERLASAQERRRRPN